ncbi:succinate dehydrogenase, hydrophobic membrane anchor protein [Pelagibacteraceae bacterium]|nr:succinate dehydrogenase, hydrophobic membrane anchor protein [Pelagibacteraceae bacterium]
MNNSTKKWLLLKYSSAILMPLMLWFIVSLVSIYDSEYQELINFFSQKTSKIILSFFLIFAFFFSSLTISEIFEDYIEDEKIKNVANKVIYIFAIIIPLITIISIFNFTL